MTTLADALLLFASLWLWARPTAPAKRAMVSGPYRDVERN